MRPSSIEFIFFYILKNQENACLLKANSSQMELEVVLSSMILSEKGRQGYEESFIIYIINTYLCQAKYDFVLHSFSHLFIK